MVILRPAPGALPELPGFGEDDDELRLLCCSPPSSTDGPTTSAETTGLDQNRPNPFATYTSIAFDLERSGAVQVEVFDASGRHVRTLLDRSMSAGNWTVSWDGRTAGGETVASGVYFCRLTTGAGTETRTMTVRR